MTGSRRNFECFVLTIKLIKEAVILWDLVGHALVSRAGDRDSSLKILYRLERLWNNLKFINSSRQQDGGHGGWYPLRNV